MGVTIRYTSKSQTIEIKDGIQTSIENNKLAVEEKKIDKSKNKPINPVFKKIQETREVMKKKAELNKQIAKVMNQWTEVMAETKSYNNMNLALTLRHLKPEDYGWSSRIYSPYGIPLERLEQLTPAIESGLECKFMYEIPEHKQFAMCKIIYPNKVKCNDMPFQPAKVKPYEIFIGVDVSGRKIILNVNNTPHILIAGQTRKGKNASGDHFITSLIHSCKPEEVEFYMFQCAKNDLIKYATCKHVKCFVLHDFIKMEKALEKLLKEIDRRLELMKPMVESLKGDNLYDYNKLYPHKKLPYTYIVIDEFMVLTLPTKDKEIAQVKANVLSMLEYVGEMGGSVGVNYAVFHQKPSKDLCPTFIKNMSLIRVCFGFDDESCGRIVLGEKFGDLALKLPARRAYYSADGKMDLIYTTNLREADGSSRIKEFIKGATKSHEMLFNDKDEEETKSDIKSDIKIDTNKVQESLEEIQPKQKKEVNIKPIISTINPPQIKEIPQESDNKPLLDKEINKTIPQGVMEFDKVDPIKIIENKEKVDENIKNNPNFVPFNPNFKPKIIIDQTKIDFSKTQKPIKKNKKEGNS